MKKLTILTTLALAAFFVSCQTFDNGGLVKKADDRLLTTWRLQAYYLNGADSTASLLISDLVETYSSDGTYIRSYYDKDELYFTESGQFNLPDKATEIDISGVSSLELTQAHSTVSSDHYIISRMKKDEFWYSYENGGAKHEFRFKQQ
jgi:hypothetical protein